MSNFIIKEHEVQVTKNTREKEIQKVFQKLPRICCDVPSILYIMETLCKKFKQDFGTDISTDY